jgi:uncharacterized protein
MRGRVRREQRTGITGFEWDEGKRQQIFENRGIDFVDCAQILLGEVFEYESDRDGEARFVAIGAGPAGVLVATVYTIRDRNIRIITARRARKNEQRTYLYAVANPPDEGAD